MRRTSAKTWKRWLAERQANDSWQKHKPKLPSKAFRQYYQSGQSDKAAHRFCSKNKTPRRLQNEIQNVHPNLCLSMFELALTANEGIIYSLYSWRALASWPPVSLSLGRSFLMAPVFGTHFWPFWGTEQVKVFFAIKSLAVKCLACLWSSWLKCDRLWSKFQPGCWAALSSFANCMVSGHVSCVTVISVCVCVCLLNSWFRPRMPHRLSGPCVFMGKLWLASLRCCARSLWVRTPIWVGHENVKNLFADPKKSDSYGPHSVLKARSVQFNERMWDDAFSHSCAWLLYLALAEPACEDSVWYDISDRFGHWHTAVFLAGELEHI